MGSRKNTCPRCGKRFASKTGLKKHLMEQEEGLVSAAKHHGEAAQALKSCYVCGSRSNRIGTVWGGGDGSVGVLLYFVLCESCYENGEQGPSESELEGFSARVEEADHD